MSDDTELASEYYQPLRDEKEPQKSTSSRPNQCMEYLERIPLWIKLAFM
jgi:hypothetical protein